MSCLLKPLHLPDSPIVRVGAGSGGETGSGRFYVRNPGPAALVRVGILWMQTSSPGDDDSFAPEGSWTAYFAHGQVTRPQKGGEGSYVSDVGTIVNSNFSTASSARRGKYVEVQSGCSHIIGELTFNNVAGTDTTEPGFWVVQASAFPLDFSMTPDHWREYASALQIQHGGVVLITESGGD